MTNKQIDQTFLDLSKLIRMHRQAAKLSQYELSQLAGTGKTVVFDIEHGKKTVQFDTLMKILNALNIKIEFSSAYLRRKKEEGSMP